MTVLNAGDSGGQVTGWSGGDFQEVVTGLYDGGSGNGVTGLCGGGSGEQVIGLTGLESGTLGTAGDLEGRVSGWISRGTVCQTLEPLDLPHRCRL